MTLVILSFAAGVLFLQLQPELPGLGWLGLCICGLVFLRKGKILRLPAAFALGFCWALGMAHLAMDDRLAPELEGRDLEVVGVVAGLPAAGERGLRFEFEPESSASPLPRKILLSWYRSAAPGGPARHRLRAQCTRGSAGASPCACAGRTGRSTRTASTTKPGCSREAWGRPGMCAPRKRRFRKDWESETALPTGSSRSASACATASSACSARRRRAASSPRSRSATSAPSRRRNGGCSAAPASRT